MRQRQTAFDFRGMRFHCDVSGAVFWGSRNTLICADLHLGQSVNSRRGTFLPPHEMEETTSKLQRVVKYYDAGKLLILGDIIDQKDGWSHLPPEVVRTWRDMSKSCQIMFVRGNHDQWTIPPFAGDCIDHLVMDEILFTHAPVGSDMPQMCGHLHPGVTLKTRAGNRKLKCLILDQQMAVLPAFGALTGKFSVSHPIFRRLFPRKGQILALGAKGVFLVAE